MVRKILENIGRDGVQLSTVEEGLKRGKEYLSHCITREREERVDTIVTRFCWFDDGKLKCLLWEG